MGRQWPLTMAHTAVRKAMGVPKRGRPPIIVSAITQSATRGRLRFGNLDVVCALGRGGRRVRKREGDGATPIGVWRVIGAAFRADRGLRVASGLTLRSLRKSDGWCDDSGDRNYNRPVRLPYRGRTEAMCRDDALYDLVVVLDHNQCPRRRGDGSAVFIHVAHDGLTPTEGCVALRKANLQRVLAMLRPGTRVIVRS